MFSRIFRRLGHRYPRLNHGESEEGCEEQENTQKYPGLKI